MPKKRIQLIARGVVQGVNFRYYTQREALKKKLTGWVRNLPDGSVAAVFEGESQAIESMIEWCRHGPPSARVTELVVQQEEFLGEFASFCVKV